MIFLALRNVARSWSHHGPVALYFGLALALVMLGQGFLENADRNLRTVYPGALTGDVLVRPATELRWTLFGSADALWGDSSLAPVLVAGDALRKDLAARAGVEAAAGVLTGPALADLEGTHHPVWVFGIETDHWQAALPSLVPDRPWSDGAFLSPALAAELGGPSELRLLYSSGQDFQIVNSSVVGVARPPVLLATLDHSLWIDAAAARHLFGRETAPAPVPIAAGEADLLNGDEADLFGGPVEVPPTVPQAALPGPPPSGAEADGGPAWNFVVVRLADPTSAEAVARHWTEAWRSEGRGVEAVTWRNAAGGSSLYVVWLQGLLAIGLLLLALIGAGSLVNAMTGIVVERTAEVGTLRALGASKALVYRLFGLEAFLVVGLGSAAALAFTGAVSGLLGVVPVQVSNAVFTTLVGGRGVQIALSPGVLAADLVAVALLAWAGTALPLVGPLGQDVIRSLEKAPE